jgi:hypothetical protein
MQRDYRRAAEVARRPLRIFCLREAGFLLFVTVFFRRGPLMVCFAALPIARFIAGDDCLILVRPVPSALAVDSNTTSAAAFAAAPKASPATDLTPWAPRCAASEMACRALVVMLLTIEFTLLGEAFDNAKRAARFQSFDRTGVF